MRRHGDPVLFALTKLYDLLEEYAPAWYTQEHRVLAEKAIARGESSSNHSNHEDVHSFDGLRVDLRRVEVSLHGRPVRLKAREFQLLRYLIERNGTAISRGELLQAVWGYDADSYTRTVDVHIAGLRRKLENDPVSPQRIVTVPGLGYRFDGQKVM